MSDSNEDYELLSIFPDISKEYKRWLTTDLNEFALRNKTNNAPSNQDTSEVATSNSKRRKSCHPTPTEELDDDVVLIEDSPPETAPVTRSRRRGCTTAGRGESVILIEDSLPESEPAVSRRGRGRAIGRDRARRGRDTRGRGKTASPALTNEVPYIIKDSDDESTGDLNISLGSEELSNYEMSVKVIWRSKDIHRFTIRKFQVMKTIFKFFSDLEGVPENKLLFMLKDKQIQPDDTPDSLQLSVVDFIDGGITTINTSLETNRNEPQLKDGELELKILCKDRKKPLTVTVHKEEKLLTLKLKVAEILELPQGNLKFIFDGETLNFNDTPADLDLEGGECIDLNIVADTCVKKKRK